MFRAITKKNGPSASSDIKGTLTALWANAGSKAGGSEVHPADAVPSTAEVEPPTAPEDQMTPAPAAKAEPASVGRAAAPPTTGGDVAIAAAPDPSPEPASAAAAAPAAPQHETHPVAAELPNKVSKDEKSERKRKRCAPDAFTEQQLTTLQASFADNGYPSAACKASLAAQLGLEAGQVDKWFVKQRKKQREEAGGVAKRGRPSKGSGSSGSKAAAPAQVSPVSGQENAAPAAAGKEQQADAMEVDEPAVVDAPAGMQKQPFAAQTPAAPAAPVEQAAVQAAGGAAEDASPAAAPLPSATPVPHPGNAPSELAAAMQQDVSASPTPAAAAPGAAAGDAVSPAAAAAPAAQAAKTPASAPARAHSLSVEEAVQLATELEEEAKALHAGGLALPLLSLPSDPPAAREPFSDARLAEFVAAQRAPLSALVAALAPLFASPDSGAPLEEAVLRSRIVNIAARKSCGPKHGDSALVDALEDGDEQRLWQWELRDQKVLPKELRLAAQQAKRRAGRVQERLSAVAAAARLLPAHKGGQASAKLGKALDALQKVKTLAQVEEEQEAERQAAADKAAAKKAASASKGGQTAEDKARMKAEKEAAREEERAAREAERERLRAEKDAEKERAKAEKDAEKERAKAEKEAEREKAKADKEAEKEAKKAKKTGFKNVDELKKSSNKFLAFFQPKAAAAAAVTPGPSSLAAAAAAGTPARSQQAGGSQQPTQEPGAEGATTGKRERGYFELFLKPPEGPHIRSLIPQPCRMESMDAAQGQPLTTEQAQAEWEQLLAAMKRRRREAAAQPKVRGLPPSWARKSNAVELAQRRLDKLKESGADPAAVPTWRRKLVWFSGDSQRPPFYGSRKPSPAVGPRKYLGRDEAVDYEVMSDLEWEEEPQDASSLSGADEEVSEMAGGEEEEEADSFICADGYLSEDEGVQVEEQEGEDMQLDAEGLSLAAAAAGMEPERVAAMQQLEAALERARRAGKPLIVSRLPGGGDGQPGGPFIQGDVSLLSALAAEVLLPGVRVTMPEDPAAEAAAAAAAAPPTAAKQASPAGGGGAATAPRPSGGPGRRAERPDDLLPELLSFVQSEPRLTKDKIAEAFREAHPTRRVPKKWVQDSVKENFEWRGTKLGWALKPAAARLPDPAAGAAAAAAALAAAAPAAPALGGAAAAAATAGDAMLVDGGAAEGLAGQSGAAAAPHTAGIERFFTAKEPASSPAVPSALRPAAPPSELRAPGRLVTTTAAGAAAAPPPPLAVPEAVSGTGDPFWRRLLAAVEGCDGDEDEPSFVAAFQPATLARLVAGMPAAVVGALVAGAAAAATPPAPRAALLRCLEGAVQALAALEAEAAGDNLTASQQAWQPRGAPAAASLAELCREPQLLAGLRACAEVLGARVAQAAAAVAAALLGSEAALAALDAAAAAEPGGGSPQGQLQAVVAAATSVATNA